MKVGIASRFRGVQSIPGASEKDAERDSPCSYPEPTQVSLGEKPKAYRVEPVVREIGKLAPYLWDKGCLRFWSTTGTVGRSDKGVLTV